MDDQEGSNRPGPGTDSVLKHRAPDVALSRSLVAGLWARWSMPSLARNCARERPSAVPVLKHTRTPDVTEEIAHAAS
jgi:hypothetical protein